MEKAFEWQTKSSIREPRSERSLTDIARRSAPEKVVIREKASRNWENLVTLLRMEETLRQMSISVTDRGVQRLLSSKWKKRGRTSGERILIAIGPGSLPIIV